MSRREPDLAYDDIQRDRNAGAVLKQFYKELDDEGDQLLRDSQEAWLQYATAKRSFAADTYRGGTLAGPVAGLSYIEESSRRIRELLSSIEDRKTP